MKLKPIETAPKEISVLCYGYRSMPFSDLKQLDFYVASKDSNDKWHYFYPDEVLHNIEPTHWCELPTLDEE